jgi:predicted DNA-binding protein with PD1-like motif
MRYSEAGLGRVFVLRLEDGDRIPGVIEQFAADMGLQRALCLILGGAGGGSRLVVGPENEGDMPPVPVVLPLEGVHEIAGVGTLFPDEEGKPSLHLHAACGRGEETRTGCVRPGVDIWKVGEVVLLELTGTAARRVRDEATGFTLLVP